MIISNVCILYIICNVYDVCIMYNVENKEERVMILMGNNEPIRNQENYVTSSKTKALCVKKRV